MQEQTAMLSRLDAFICIHLGATANRNHIGIIIMDDVELKNTAMHGINTPESLGILLS